MKSFCMAVVVLVFLIGAVPVRAQAPDPCVAPNGSQDTIVSGQKPTITWTLDPSKPLEGFYVEISGGVLAKTDIGKPTPTKTCANGFAGYTYVPNVTPGVGSYTAKVYVWNKQLDGTPQEVSAVRPFVVANQTASPALPTNLRITGQ